MVDERPKEEKLLWVIFDRTTTDGEKAAAVERLKQVTGKDARGLVEKYLETASSSSSSSLGSDYQARRISELRARQEIVESACCFRTGWDSRMVGAAVCCGDD
jgi:hypothetical protein